MTDTLRDRLGALPTEEIARMLTAAIVMAEMGEIPAKVTVSQWRAALLAAQPAPAVMGDWPLVRAKDAATSFTIALPITEQMLREAMMWEERDTLIDHYYQDQGVTPEGELRPLVSKLLKRVERAEAALARTAAAESREGGIKVIWHGTTDSHGTNDSKECSTGRVYTDPLMQQAYDEGFAHGARQPGESPT